MDQSEQLGNEAGAAGATPEPQGPDAQEVQAGPSRPSDTEQAPPRAPRKRRTASAPAGAPPAAPVIDAVPPVNADPEVVEGAPVRRRATRTRKPAVTAVVDGTSAAVGVGTPISDGTPPADAGTDTSRAAVDSATEAEQPARAPRTRRRAATAEAGPAAPVDGTVTAPSLPAAQIDRPVVVPAAAGGPGTEAGFETGVASGPTAGSAPVPPVRATRTRRRAATAEAGPAIVTTSQVESAPARTAPADAPGADVPPVIRQESATSSKATSEIAAEDTAAVEPPSAVTEVPAGDAAAGERPARTRRPAGDRSRSRRRTSNPSDTAPEDVTPTDDAPASSADTSVQGADAAVPESAAGTAEDAVPDTDTDTDMGTDSTPTDGNGRAVEETPAGQAGHENRFDPFAVPESPLSLLFHAPDLSTVTVPAVKVGPSGSDDSDDTDESEEQGQRSRRSRRGRNRTRTEGNGADRTDDASGDDGPSSDEDPTPRRAADQNGPDDGPGVTSRRRRRRRRGDQDLELTGGEDDDPPNTVTRVRAPRQAAEPVSDRVTGVRGSTRLEAKKQRRRESRDTGRRRQVITEAEFLARRESVDRQMIVRQHDDRIQIGVLEDGILGEHFVSRTQQDSLIGNVYLGKVQNVLPSMEAAFVDIGRGRNAVLYAGEVNWDAAGLDGQPRRIELALKSGDPVLVQVTKDPVGHKGARLTSQISLPGRYLVYVPGGSMTGISRKLPDVERNRLKRILKDRLPENAGVIVRTAAEGASEEELTHDINRLRAQWEEIERKTGSTKILAPELLYGEPDLTIKVVRDVFNEDFSKLVVSGEEAWDTIEAYVMYVAPDLVGRLEKWTSDEDIFAASRIDEQIAKALERKVFLPSGGSLVIDRTEAMTVVDVNTGKFTGSGGNLEETVTKNNLEAAEEVVRQLRLRDIGGIIVIDFIDMVLEANRDLVLRRLVECLGRDRTKHQVAEVTSLGLVQMTRKRMGTGLLEVFGEDCEHCAGRGVVTHMEPVEHRHAPIPEPQQPPRQDRPSRSERKRGRGRGGQQDEGFAPTPAAVESPDRAAKAEAARAALASIAAATHHAHEEAPDSSPEEVDVQVTEAVLTINGETVTLPRADARRIEGVAEVTEPAPATRLTLDGLSEAFNRRTVEPGDAPAPQDEDMTGEPETTLPGAVGSTPQPTGAEQPTTRTTASTAPVRRPRRRVARSAQGAADTSIETSASEDVEQPSGTRHTVTARPVSQRPGSASEPVVLGVGVPASEL